MLSSDQLIHDKANSPDIDSFPVCGFTEHLFWSLVNQSPTGVVNPDFALELDSQTEVDQFDALKVAGVADYDIAWLHISVDEVKGMEMLQTLENALQRHCTLFLSQRFTRSIPLFDQI
jgi:hypothetical protein